MFIIGVHYSSVFEFFLFCFFQQKMSHYTKFTDLMGCGCGRFSLIMPPTSKKLEGHIASGLFVRPSICHAF